MTPRLSDRYALPSGSVVQITRLHEGERVECRYLRRGGVVQQRAGVLCGRPPEQHVMLAAAFVLRHGRPL